MCLYPRIIRNPKYKLNKKNKGIIPEVNDKRTEYVPIGCGKCIECMKQKSRQWKIRLTEEIRENNTGKFVTLTFSNDSLEKLKMTVSNDQSTVSNDQNEIAVYAVRHFLERWRKEYKTSIKHWLITELGHKGTERIHLHGLLFTPTIIKDDKPYNTVKDIERIWQYGWVYIGKYVNEKTINYISKYITKLDPIHKEYTGKILCSPGIGNNYINRPDSKNNHYQEKNTNELYITRSGNKIALPTYYRNKIYSETEREKLWIEKLDKQERYVLGQKTSIKDNEEQYFKLLAEARAKNQRLGYGSIKWSKKEYIQKLDQIKHVEKIPQVEKIKKQPVEKNIQQKIGFHVEQPEIQQIPSWITDGKAFE